ncbi:coiled-coil domain-containing protein-domain-containing protein [Daldinia caldariorum]|uniref:coiled-coil domain-containing protein-domain-containing protein n=1 Tax=Daldinia caldariorum TaxID=326644 RepID=UPI002008DA62|nr:coiled-coil domain-containing protein-domain-containing protein [Daldinia caldariorum]KAI1472435.1 coiled-coil domain-containing protein-domain-containing protein [Daldinia caldariorum]
MSISPINPVDAAGDASPIPPAAPPSPPASSASSPGAPYVKPQPRAPRSPAHSAQIRVQNRRREYLERNPGYFGSLEHELADPVLYDALIRQFQSAEEREKEGRVKGYSRVLEVDLLRGEAKLAHLTSSSSQQAADSLTSQQQTPSFPTSSSFSSWLPQPAAEDADPFIRETATGGDGLFGVEKGGLPRRPETREEGRERWVAFLRRRFVLGRDEDFDYSAVDENDELDVLERREQEDAWFDDEDPGWASDGPEDRGGGEGGGGEAGEGGGGGTIGGKRLEGETGIQDF